MTGRVLSGNPIALTLGGHKTGTLDYSDATSSMNIVMQYGNGGTAVSYVWIGLAGSDGATGTVTVAADVSGSMQVTVPISANSPGIATQPITVSGAWT
jgi:hypothetical protein